MIDFDKERSANCYVYHQSDTNLNFSQHVHINCEVVFVYEGEMLVTVENIGYRLTANSAILIMPGLPHSIETKENSRSYLCVFSPDNVEEFFNFSKNCELVNPVFLMPDTGFVDTFRKESHNKFIQRSFLYFVCGCAVRAGLRKRRQDDDKQLVFKIINYINSHYRENITLRKMALQLSYNYTYLSNYFNRQFKSGFSNVVNNYRVNHAKRLLSHSQLSMGQIAKDCGFTTIRNFNRAFLQAENVSPKKYRETNRGRESERPAAHPSAGKGMFF